jgi:hypothetical protein
MDKPVPPERPTPESSTGVERQSSLDRRRVTAEAPRGFDNRRIVKPFGRADQKRTEFATQQCRVLDISRKNVRLQVVDADNIPDSFFCCSQTTVLCTTHR